MVTQGIGHLNSLTRGRAAAEYMRLGHPVFPCLAGGKAPDPTTRRGYKAAAVLPEDRLPRLADAWDAAGWNIGLPTGLAFDVLDVDVKDGRSGMAALHALEEAGLTAGAFAHASTPSGGLHLYFPSGDGRCRSLPKWGLDFKGQGGYVLAPPSAVLSVAADGVLSDSGYRWTWARDLAMGAPLDWAAVERTLGVRSGSASRSPRPRGDVRATVEGLAVWLRTQPVNRNSALHWAASRAVEEGARTSEELRPLVESSLELSGPGEDREEELWKTVQSPLRRA